MSCDNVDSLDCSRGSPCIVVVDANNASALAATGVVDCTGCCCWDGWVGARCGTAISESVAVGFVSVTGALALLLFCAALQVLGRLSWRPFVARGPGSMVASYLSGACWCYALAASSVAAELLQYSAQNAALHRLWAGLVGGFGACAC